MCGISACIQLTKINHTSNNYQVFVDALGSLKHRGPDDSGHWSSENKSVLLGHTRLSIIDLNSGHQPITSTDENIIAVVNGEFYDYKKIRNKLIDIGYTFKTESDSEIIIPLYQEYGIEFLKHLKGEFAFIIYDKKNHRVLFGRDRFGIKPLFYSIFNDVLYVASEVKCLLAMGVPKKLDESAYLRRKFNLSRQSIYHNIYSVQPAHYITTVSTKQEIVEHQYWNFNFERNLNSVPQNICEATDAVHNLLYESVSCRLVSDQPIAFYLSGGLDSSAILGIAHNILGKSLPAFTLSFSENKKFDEREYAKLMADHVNADLHVVNITQDLLADNFESAVLKNEMPIFNANAIGKFILSKEVHRAGFKVVLTGEGADEIFSGYSHFRKDMLMNDRVDLSQNLSDIEKLIQKRVGATITWLSDELIKARAIYQLFSNVKPTELPITPILTDVISLLGKGSQWQACEPMHLSMLLWSKTMLPNFVLCALGDRMEMAHHVEGRLPFLDHKLVEFVSQLPASFKIKDRAQKFILREAVKNYLPESLYRRKKHYFQAPPLLANTKGNMYSLVQDVLRSSALESLSFLDSKKTRMILDQLSHKSISELSILEPVLMEIVSLCFIQKNLNHSGLNELNSPSEVLLAT